MVCRLASTPVSTASVLNQLQDLGVSHAFTAELVEFFDEFCSSARADPYKMDKPDHLIDYLLGCRMFSPVGPSVGNIFIYR